MWSQCLAPLLLACSVMARSDPNDKPWFCHGLDCPAFTVKESNSEYELRSYSEGALQHATCCSNSFTTMYANLFVLSILFIRSGCGACQPFCSGDVVSQIGSGP